MKNYSIVPTLLTLNNYVEVLESQRNKLMGEFEVLAKGYLELSKAWQNTSERWERLGVDKDKQQDM